MTACEENGKEGDSDDDRFTSWNHESPGSADTEEKSFFSRLVSGCRQNYQLTDWTYTIGIFLLVTFILTFPLYMSGAEGALALVPAMAIFGVFVALFTAYILTPFSLRHFRPYREDPKLQQYLEDLAHQAGIKTPKLLVAETPEINALAFTSILGGRVCLTRGMLDANSRGHFTDDEIRAIMGHEIGHLKHGDCFKWSFILSWLSIFDLMGTILLVLGGSFIATGAVTTVLSDRDNSGPLLAVMGIGMVIAGVLQRLLGKIASIPAFHLSRRHEFAADLEGARLTSPDAQISALQKIERYNNYLEAKKLAQLPFSDRWQTAPLNMSWIDNLFSTHPPIDRRVRELQQSIGSHLAYPAGSPLQPQGSPATAKPMPHAAAPTVSSTPSTDSGKETPLKSFVDTLLFPFRKPDPEMMDDQGAPKQKWLRKNVLIPVFICLGIVLAGVFFIAPSIGQPALPSSMPPDPHGDASIPQFTKTPTITPAPTTLPTTPPPQLSLGESAKIALPHSENLAFNYNTVYRQISSASIVTITYAVDARQVTEIREISSPSGDYTKRVTYNDPSAYLVITVRDANSKEIISTDGFGKQYASTPEQKMIVRKTGDLEIEMTGARVTVDLAIN